MRMESARSLSSDSMIFTGVSMVVVVRGNWLRMGIGCRKGLERGGGSVYDS